MAEFKRIIILRKHSSVSVGSFHTGDISAFFVSGDGVVNVSILNIPDNV